MTDQIPGRHGADADLRFSRHGSAVLIELTRQHALNALTHAMCTALHEGLKTWRDDSSITHVVLAAEPGRAFCAGGDVKAIWHAGMAGTPDNRFFHDEYRMNAAFGLFEKPIISLVDGIVMGGGFGISAHGSERIVTENTRFAMPETGIGLIPDVGGSHALPRYSGGAGFFLGLTGMVVGAADCLAAGYATRFVPSDQISQLKADLLATSDPSAILATLTRQPEDAAVLAPHADIIQSVLLRPDAASVMEGLLELCSNAPELSKAAARLPGVSPTSFALTLEALRRGTNADLRSCLAQEYRIVSNILRATDLYEGIGATLIDRTRKPAWSPATISEVTPTMISRYCDTAPFGELDLADL